MLFNSVGFLIFFPVVLLVYYVIPKKIKQLWLLAASYYFYMCWNAKYAILILTSTAITYASGLLLEKAKKMDADEITINRCKKTVVALSFASNLGILCYFKYANFILYNLTQAFALIHINLSSPVIDVILPVGISFYTFQALSYTMDVYRDEIYAERNFFRYALFVSFFPQLVAGPIERSKNLLRQLAEPKKFDYDMAREGFLLMLWGFFLKLVLADRIAVFVDTVYGDYTTYGGCYLIAATLLFAVQIYCDFSGYSTIAMGAAMFLGIRLMENFNAPYLSTSVGEFWRNWHISLTSWFKDYLYIPMGGSRKGTWRKYLNKLTVFLVSGLWHGAQFTYVAWGGLNGIYQIVGEATKPVRDKAVSALKLHRNSTGHRIMQAAVTFALVDFSWIFFRARSIQDAFSIIHSMIAVKNPWVIIDGSFYSCGLDEKNFRLLTACILLLLIADIFKRRGIQLRKVILRQDYWFRWIFIAVSVCAVVLFGKYGERLDSAAFIYFQF